MDYASIGLSDADQELVYVWIDGSTPDYLNWAPNEPSNSWEGEDFVAIFGPIHLHHGMWLDNSLNVPHGFVCERQLRQIEGKDELI